MKESSEHVSSTAIHQSSAKADDIVSKHTPKPFLKGGGRESEEGRERERKRERERERDKEREGGREGRKQFQLTEVVLQLNFISSSSDFTASSLTVR